VAYDGVDALAQASAELPDVLLIDIGMPKMDGFQLACHLRRQIRYVNTLLVAVTGWADRPHRRLWTAAFDHYLIKPVDPSKLDKLLRDRGRLVRSRIGGAGTSDDIRPGVSPPEGLHLAPGRATQIKSTLNQFLQGSSTCCD
jgi:CheY-like chemotaxis protein